jgi:hypothetical protein
MTETFTAFAGHRSIAAGDLPSVARAAAATDDPVLVLDDATGAFVELDLRHGADAAVAAYRARTASPPAPRPGRGRPRLGVVAREVTLLPRHWDWLAAQPGGASAALRRLVDEARRTTAEPDRIRRARDAVFRAMTTLGGDLPGYEEAARALFAGDREGFAKRLGAWPDDLAAYLLRLSSATEAESL